MRPLQAGLRLQAAFALLVHFRSRLNRSWQSFARHLLVSLLLASALAPGLSPHGASRDASPWGLSPAKLLPGWGLDPLSGGDAASEAAELRVPHLEPVRTWVSPRSLAGGQGVTLVTQLSLSRWVFAWAAPG